MFWQLRNSLFILYNVTFQKFDKAAADVKKLKSLPGNDDLLILYALFKQGTVGDVNTGMLFNLMKLNYQKITLLALFIKMTNINNCRGSVIDVY